MIRLACWKTAKRWPRLSIGWLAVAVFAAGNGYAQVPPGTGQVSTPGSSIEKPGDAGVRAHTNIQTFIPPTKARTARKHRLAAAVPARRVLALRRRQSRTG